MTWERGEVVLRREVLSIGVWLVVPVHVVSDEPDLLVTYLPEGAPFGFPPGDWPTPDGRHPWHGRERWTGHGTLMLQRPGDDFAVWHFWDGPERTFRGWYVNLQEDFRRTTKGYDTQDLELDILVSPTGEWEFKDWELVDERVAEGRFSAEQARAIRAQGEELGARLDRGERWWDDAWASWSPDRSWVAPPLPDGWEAEFA